MRSRTSTVKRVTAVISAIRIKRQGFTREPASASRDNIAEPGASERAGDEECIDSQDLRL